MFREPGVVACLNHYLQEGVTFVTYDLRSWIWSAADFSEGEIISEKFCLFFESDRNATAFKAALENVVSARSAIFGANIDRRIIFHRSLLIAD